MITRIVLFIIILFSLNTTSQAQISFSTNYKEYCEWNDWLKDFEEDCWGAEESALFEMNRKETMFYQNDFQGKKAYFIRKKEYDYDNEVFIYYVLADDGKRHIVILDLIHDEIRFVNIRTKRMTRYFIKDFF